MSQSRAIQTPEELFLLLTILDSQGKFEENATILHSQNLGIDSRIAQNDWSFVRAKLENLAKASLWEESLSYARELLALPDDTTSGATNPQEKDDWAVWDVLLKATDNIKKETYD